MRTEDGLVKTYGSTKTDMDILTRNLIASIIRLLGFQP